MFVVNFFGPGVIIVKQLGDFNNISGILRSHAWDDKCW